MFCAPSFPPSYTAPSLSVCSPFPSSASGPQGEPLCQHNPAAGAPLETALSIRGSSSSCSREGPSTHLIFFHIQAQWKTILFHCHFPAVTVLWTHGSGKEIHVFEPNPTDARPPFMLQQELSTKSVDPFLAELHFKKTWPDKILFLCRKEHFWIDAEFPLTSW